MKHFCKLAATAAVLCSVTAGGPVGAATLWTSVAAGCVADAGSIQGNRYKAIDRSAIGFSGKNTKSVTLVCPVAVQTTPDTKGPEVLSMTFKDSSGSSPSGHLEAKLFRTGRSTGVSEVMANVTSGTSASTGIQQVTNQALTRNCLTSRPSPTASG